jgi:hypothetical protein
LNQSLTRFQQTFYGLLLVFLSVLSVSGTIALRNILHLLLLLGLTGYIWVQLSVDKKVVVRHLRAIPVPLVIWIAYLLLFPFIAPDKDGALDNLFGKGMWGESILTWVLAWGSVLILGAGRLGLWPLALVSAVPVFIHLLLLLFAWAGVLQPSFYADPSLFQFGVSLVDVVADYSLIHNPFGSFPMGFRGIEPMHGNLGYPASQAMCLALALAFGAWRENNQCALFKSTILIACCFISVIVAQSRAAAYFGLFLIGLSFLFYWTVKPVSSSGRSITKLRSGAGKVKAIMVLASIGFISLLLFFKVISTNPVWYSMWDNMSLGFQIDNPKALLCEGFTSTTHDFVRKKHAGQSEEYVKTLIDGLNGDGARVMMARTGFDLVLENPWGLNGDRDAYQRRMEQSCGHIPAMNYAHAHNAWINMALGIGVIGILIYFFVLLNFVKTSLIFLGSNSKYFSMALFLLSFFWLLRGGVDAVYQEHYLQMQAFWLFFLYLRAKEMNDPRNCG